MNINHVTPGWFDSLGWRDFENGVVLDEISAALADRQALLEFIDQVRTEAETAEDAGDFILWLLDELKGYGRWAGRLGR